MWPTAFICNDGLYEFIRMPFGLKSAGNKFVRVIKHILQPISSFAEPFVDDAAVFSHNWEVHMNHIFQFLSVISESGLTLNIDKCHFGKSKVTYLGHLIGSGSIAPDPEKNQTPSQYHQGHDNQRCSLYNWFFSYFRSFIPGFSELANCITDLTTGPKNNKVVRAPIHDEAL